MTAFENVYFTGNTLHYTEEGVPQEKDFFHLLILWARKYKAAEFQEELAQIKIDVPQGHGPIRMTFERALTHLPATALKTATKKAIDTLLPEAYDHVPRKAPAVLRKMGKIYDIDLPGSVSTQVLFKEILNNINAKLAGKAVA